MFCYENPPHPPLPHAGGRARVGVAHSGQLARVFIRRGDPDRVMTDCYNIVTMSPGIVTHPPEGDSLRLICLNVSASGKDL